MSIRKTTITGPARARASCPVTEDRPGGQKTGSPLPDRSPQPDAVSNLVSDALDRLRHSIVVAQTSPGSAACASAASSSLAELRTVQNASCEAGFTIAAQTLLRSVPATGVINAGRQQTSTERLSVLAHAALFRSTASTTQGLNNLAEDALGLSLPKDEIARGAGIALHAPSKMDSAAMPAVALELVRGGARFDQVLRHLGLSFGSDTYDLQAQILREIGLPLVRSGRACNHVLKQLGITCGGPATLAFELDVVAELGVPQLMDGKAAEEITAALGIFGGPAYYTFKQFASDRLTMAPVPEGASGSSHFPPGPASEMTNTQNSSHVANRI